MRASRHAHRLRGFDDGGIGRAQAADEPAQERQRKIDRDADEGRRRADGAESPRPRSLGAEASRPASSGIRRPNRAIAGVTCTALRTAFDERLDPLRAEGGPAERQRDGERERRARRARATRCCRKAAWTLAARALYSTTSDRPSKRPATNARRDDCERQRRDRPAPRSGPPARPCSNGEPDQRRAGEPETGSEDGARCGGPAVEEHFGGRARFARGRARAPRRG